MRSAIIKGIVAFENSGSGLLWETRRGGPGAFDSPTHDWFKNGENVSRDRGEKGEQDSRYGPDGMMSHETHSW